MARFGDFTLLEDLGRSTGADRYKANHDAQGGPFFLKIYSRLDMAYHKELLARCERLIGTAHPNLPPHLGHGVVDGVAFVVAPYYDGIDLVELATSLKDRRVNLGMDALLMVLLDLAKAVGALHEIAGAAQQTLMAHGDVSMSHVRVGTDGQVWLTGLTTPRGFDAQHPPEGVWDLAGVGALVYDLLPLLRGGSTRPPLPAALERVVRRALGVSSRDDRLSSAELTERFTEAKDALKLKLDRPIFAELVRRTARAVEKKLKEMSVPGAPSLAARPLDPANRPRVKSGSLMRPRGLDVSSPADNIPMLDPLEALPTLEPMIARDRVAVPAPILELVPLDGPYDGRADAHPTGHREAQATTRLVNAGQPQSMQQAALQQAALQQAALQQAALQQASPQPSPLQHAPPQQQGVATARATQPLPPLPPPAAAPPGMMLETPRMPTALFQSPYIPVAQPTPAEGKPTAPAPARVAPPAQTDRPRDVSGPMTVAPGRAVEPRPPPLPASLLREALAPRPSVAPQAAAPSSLPAASPAGPPLGFAPASTPPAGASPPGSSPTAGRAPATNRALEETTRPGELPAGLQDAHGLAGASAGASADMHFEPGGGPAAAQAKGGMPAATASRTGKVPRPKRPLLADPEDTAERARKAPLVEETDPGDRPAAAEDPRKNRSIEALVRRGLVSDDDIDRAVALQQQRGGRLVETLVAENVVTDAEVADALAEEAIKPRISDAFLLKSLPPAALCRRLPQTYALGRRVLALSIDQGAGGARLILAVADPFDEALIDEVRMLLGASSVQVHVAARGALTRATVDAYKALGLGAVPGSAAHQAPTVLLCIGDDVKAGKIGSRLVQEGYRVEHVVDGVTARDILLKRPPDVVLCAHDLKDLNGTSLLMAAREHESTIALPFFVIGPRGDDALVARVLDLGADDYFNDPVRLDVVVAKLRRALGKAAPRGTGDGNTTDMSAPMVAAPRGPDPDRNFLVEQTPLMKVPVATSAPVPGASAGRFLDNLDLPSMDDLPDLPPDDLQSQPDMPAMPTGVMGTLKQMAVPEIVQSLELGRKTARVELVPSEGQKGMIAFEMGSMKYAECGDARGDEAFYRLAHHKEGYFRIHYGDKPPGTNIHHPTTYLLLEAMRRMDEAGENIPQTGKTSSGDGFPFD